MAEPALFDIGDLSETCVSSPPYANLSGIPTIYNSAVPKGQNPMLHFYGAGPEGTVCKTCQHLESGHCGGTFVRKCNRRKMTHSKATDHRATWPACGLYEVEK